MNQPHTEARILVIEDEADIAELLCLHLGDVYSEIVHESDGEAGLARAMAEPWDLLVLDIRLPGIDGLEICRRLRTENQYLPILMLTAKTTELDRVLGLEIGADDYMSKPFSVVELIARVKALMRRASAFGNLHRAGRAKDVIKIADLSIDTSSRNVSQAGETVELTAKEFDLLLHFAKHPNKVFRRSELLDTVWGYGHEGYEHTVNSHINRLRSKIHPGYIVTVWGVGYKMVTTS
ncbi:response regulator transcription factor [Exilibacterium tricleocarpae]|uniref:Phosphate regulon transcriptional regulatory protein PhoB n=1 Tax=Exilibacterium tricleocarpae TaxID=2591008 RepID=A0A545T0G2_9GAMM|nr:response regulator transcription factor [Exilibacterium tricleocarpae]TQV70696.1 response regulator transcription factor [Exilibacterium tricleocarpae]